MNHAVEIEDLARLAEGTLGAADEARVRSHLDECIACRSQLADLRAIDRMVGPTEEGPALSGVEGEISASLDERLDAILQRLICAPPVTRPIQPPVWARPVWIGGLVAFAASIILAVMLREDSPSRADVRGRVVLASAAEVVRSGRKPTVHFELTLSRSGFVAIFQASARGLRLVFPHPNPVLGTFGMTAPIPKDTPIRIPPSAVADYPASEIPPSGRVLVAVLTGAPTTASMQAIVDEINRSGDTDPGRLQQSLSARLGPITILDGP